jgi:hypothetical protein
MQLTNGRDVETAMSRRQTLLMAGRHDQSVSSLSCLLAVCWTRGPIALVFSVVCHVDGVRLGHFVGR